MVVTTLVTNYTEDPVFEKKWLNLLKALQPLEKKKNA